MIKPEETWLVTSYGALMKEKARLQLDLCSRNALNTQIECFKTKLRKEKLLNKWLNEEVHIQAKVISQLEVLLKDAKTMRNTRTRSLCELGHKWCKIDHSMYNHVSRLFQTKFGPLDRNLHDLLRWRVLVPEVT